ncbi:MAG: hypothetical protein LC798_12005 [Chloroflexi bacterium]|nr:hypothetical protein [Chloroflexota bacterium]
MERTTQPSSVTTELVHVVEVADPSEPPLVFAELADAEAYLVSRGRGHESPFTQQVIDARLAAIMRAEDTDDEDATGSD